MAGLLGFSFSYTPVLSIRVVKGFLIELSQRQSLLGLKDAQLLFQGSD
jgi:hypothetical protein